MTDPKRGKLGFVGFEVDEEQYQQLKQVLERQGLTIEEWVAAKVQELIRQDEQESGKPPH